MIGILLVIFLIATLGLGTDKTAKAIITLFMNFGILMIILSLVSKGMSPVLTTTVGCIVIAITSLVFQNNKNIKTLSALMAVLVVIFILLTMIYFFVSYGNLQGFPVGDYKIRETNGYSGDIGINMIQVQIAVIILYLIGAIIDTAISITSSVYQVHINNKELSRKELYLSGIKMGKDIINSTINTLYFIFLGEFLATIFIYMEYYDFHSLINSKEFVQEVMAIGISAIGCVIIMPVSAAIASIMCKRTAKNT